MSSMYAPPVYSNSVTLFSEGSNGMLRVSLEEEMTEDSKSLLAMGLSMQQQQQQQQQGCVEVEVDCYHLGTKPVET